MDDTMEPTITVGEWLDRVRASLDSSADLSLTTAEEQALLGLARVAAHASERIAAPLSTYLAGVALGGLPPEGRANALAKLLQDL